MSDKFTFKLDYPLTQEQIDVITDNRSGRRGRMTKDEAIYRLNALLTMCEYRDAYGDRVDSEPYEEAIGMAIESLKQNQWIPCSERLPSENGNYLVTAIWKGKAEVDMDYFQFLCQWDDYKDTVVAWMPLPKPWKGEQKNESR